MLAVLAVLAAITMGLTHRLLLGALLVLLASAGLELSKNWHVLRYYPSGNTRSVGAMSKLVWTHVRMEAQTSLTNARRSWVCVAWNSAPGLMRSQEVAAAHAAGLGPASPAAIESVGVKIYGRNTLAALARCGDRPAVATRAYLRTVTAALWDDKQLDIKALATLIAGGVAPALTTLSLMSNEIADGSLRALAAALAAGTTPHLRLLWLDRNVFGDKGLDALAAAIAGGALPALEEVRVGRALAEHPKMAAACRARGVRLV